MPQIDGLRFIAIIAVLAFHIRAITGWHLGVSGTSTYVNGPVNWMFDAGHNGVALFFAVSGFILALPFARMHLGLGEPVRLKAYYLRRLTRLEPPYVIHLLFLLVLTALVLRYQPTHTDVYQRPDWLRHTLQNLGVSLFYGTHFVYTRHPLPNIVLWSLEVEVQFYLCAPFLACLFALRSAWTRRAIFAGLMLAPLIWLPLIPNGNWLVPTLLGQLQFFMAGFLVCDLFLTAGKDFSNRSWFWDLVFLAGIAGVVSGGHLAFVGTCLPGFVLLICLGAFRGRFASKVLSWPWITTVGGMCYTIYMYHWLMISALIRFTAKAATHVFWLDLLIQFALMTVIIVAVCAVLFALFERPFMKRDWPSDLRKWAVRRWCALKGNAMPISSESEKT
ncbi:MAG TPA: acyltransferase [Verrucomicrobiae bacterium]